MIQPVHRAVVKLHGIGIYLPYSAIQESDREPQFEKFPLNRDKFLAGLTCKTSSLTWSWLKAGF